MIPVEAIERVIDDLETRLGRINQPIHDSTISALIRESAYECVVQYAIQELQKVVFDYGARKS